MTFDSVRVPLGERSYDIFIGAGLVEQAGALIGPFLKRSRTVVVTDDNVFAAQGERLSRGLSASGVELEFVCLAPGEATKSFAELEKLTGRLLDLGVERDDAVIAFGGGVIGDLTGFACSMLRRGCRFIQMPTSLLAQTDSAVGGKTAINVSQGKNLIGAFYQPSLVIADIDTLKTLPPRELRAGYAEVVKYGLIGDEEFFRWLETNGVAMLSGDAAARTHAVKVACKSKAEIVSADEQERGKRALLNLGHTFGHAFEAHFGYSSKMLHGEAVALGMMLAFEYSVQLGLCAPAAAARVKAHLQAAHLPVQIKDVAPDITADQIVAFMMQDKKIEQGKLTLILVRGIGQAFVAKDTSVDDLTTFLKQKTR